MQFFTFVHMQIKTPMMSASCNRLNQYIWVYVIYQKTKQYQCHLSGIARKCWVRRRDKCGRRKQIINFFKKNQTSLVLLGTCK